MSVSDVQADISDIYLLATRTTGVFVNIALQEPFGLTLIEAAVHGAPIVATVHGGPVDIVKTLKVCHCHTILHSPIVNFRFSFPVISPHPVRKMTMHPVHSQVQWTLDRSFRFAKNDICIGRIHKSFQTCCSDYLCACTLRFHRVVQWCPFLSWCRVHVRTSLL
jgi:glycosyltransferase involved in cell wall biosynthesis